MNQVNKLKCNIITKSQESQEGQELNGIHQLLISVDDINFCGQRCKYHKEKHRSSIRCH